MYSLILVVMLSSQLWSLPVFDTIDKQPVYMHTQKYTVAVGQFATIDDCEAYRALSPRPFVPFTLDFTDANGILWQYPLVETTAYPPKVGQFYVQGCA